MLVVQEGHCLSIMKNSKPWLVVSILASFAAISWIATAGLVDVEEDGVLWRYVYEGDVIPNQNLDAPFVLDRHNEDPVEEVVEDSGNQILRQTMKEGGWGWRIGGPGAHVGKDVALMLEMRARIVSGSGFLLGAELRNGDDGGAALKVSPDTVVFAISGVKENTQPQEIGNEFHVYRITVDSSGAKLSAVPREH